MMKKFLSSLLALTMILSLVIVPANAAVGSGDTIAGVSVSKSTVTLNNIGDTQNVTFTVPKNLTVGDTVNVNGKDVFYSGNLKSSISSANNDVAMCSQSCDTVTITADGYGETTITYTVSFNYLDNGTSATATQTLTTKVTVAAPNVTYSFTGTPAVKAKVDGKDVSNVKHNTTVDFSIDGDITVKSKTGDAEEVTLTKGTDYTLEYAWSGVSGSSERVSQKLTNTTSSPKTVTAGCTITVKVGGEAVGSPVKCTAAKVIVASEPGISITGSVQKVGENYEVLKGGRLELTASATGVENPTYKWYVNDSIDSSHGRNEKYILTASDTTRTGTTTVTCKVFSGDNETPVKETTCTYKIVDEDVRLTLDKESVTLSKKGAYDTVTASVIDWSTDRPVSGEVKYKFTPSKRGVVSLSSSENTTGKTRITLDANDTVTITVEATYKGKTLDAKTIYVTGELLSASLDKVENGDPLKFDYDDLEAAANKALPSRVNVKKNSYINLSGVPTAADEGGVLYYGSNKVSASGRNIDKNDSLEFRTAAGFIGDATMTMTVSGDDNKSYTITLTIPVISAGTIKETVTGNAANKDVTFTNSDYKYLYYTTSKVSDYNGYYDGSSKVVGKFDGLVKEDKTVTIPASKFNNSKTVTLYVVGLDDDGVASTGTIEVSQKSYAIEYNVVAGETLSFDQKAFESFMEDYADDNIKTSKGDYFEFDYVKFDSLPNSTREGVLYEGKDKIKTSTEVENLDKVSFESVAKAKDTIKVPFTLYAKQYDKNDKVIDKKVSMTGEVVISVVKEDIVFEVGVNSAIKLGSDKFIDFLRDSDKSYKKADLDYVTFDVGKNSAITSYFNGTGALYRYYNGSTGINATVSAKDEFYYNPKTSSKHYDLDDVTYVTSKFAKVGDIVYIPFTAYGTKSGQKAEGTLAIKVKQTMNFVDVHTYDYFYDSVQWAVNLDITKGTSATTFSPKQGCTRAQIVTFLWRAANSPAPRSSTNKFTDVYATTHADYMKAIIWATEQGITTGTGNGKFSPDATCTRAQIVTFLYRFKSNPAVYGSLNFSDVNKTEHAAFYNAILWAVNNKITTGYGNGIFDPNGTCNRGDAVTFLYRALA